MITKKIKRRLREDKNKFGNIEYFYENKKYNLSKIYDWAIEDRSGSITTIATLYFSGQLIDCDKLFAVSLLENHIERFPVGNMGRYLNLGGYYSSLSRFEKAKSLYEHLVDIEFAPGAYRLANMYASRNAGEADIKQSLMYLRKASDLGHTAASGRLAILLIANGSLLEKVEGFVLFLRNIPRAVLFAFLPQEEKQSV